MESPEISGRSRPVVFEVKNKRRIKKSSKARRQQQSEIRENDEISSVHDMKQLPLETLPILDSVLEYGRRMHALGALKGADMLLKLSEKIEALVHCSTNEQILQLASDVKREGNSLKSMLQASFSEQD